MIQNTQRKNKLVKRTYARTYVRMYVKVLTLLFVLSPTIVSAQTTLGGLINGLQTIINALIPLAVSAATLAVLWGLAQYAFKAGDENAQAEGRRIMFWGVVTLFVMVSIWGFVSLLQTTIFGEGFDFGAPTIPMLPTDPNVISPPMPATS